MLFSLFFPASYHFLHLWLYVPMYNRPQQFRTEWTGYVWIIYPYTLMFYWFLLAFNALVNNTSTDLDVYLSFPPPFRFCFFYYISLCICITLEYLLDCNPFKQPQTNIGMCVRIPRAQRSVHTVLVFNVEYTCHRDDQHSLENLIVANCVDYRCFVFSIMRVVMNS